MKTIALLSTMYLLLNPVFAASEITFDEVNNTFGAEANLTDLQKDEMWKKYRGKCVEWTGILTHLDSGMFGGIDIGMKHLRETLTFDVLISAPKSMKEKFMSWQQNKQYTYRATLERYGGFFLPISADWGCE
ncbi:MAG: hypothetical protein OXC41_01790 [Gammaproteobacteria bacterium]|nr:hypothetical protein [Gammaproteobacteria bacterium]